MIGVHYLSGNPLDRRDDLRQDPRAFERLLARDGHVVVPVRDSLTLVRGDGPVFATFVDGDRAARLIRENTVVALLGEVGDRLHWLVAVEPALGESLAEDLESRFLNLREVSPLLDAPSAAILAHARALAHFHAQHVFCGRCGSPTVLAGLGNWRRCSDDSCGYVTFPRTDPAIITRLARGHECLLVRQPGWRPRQYATVAGFVEPGESLEEAVAREVAEEVGLEVLQVGYHSSQPWPFPSGIMIGFDVQVAGEVSLKGDEIEDARWFTRARLARAVEAGEIRLPSPFSISYRLISDWLEAPG